MTDRKIPPELAECGCQFDAAGRVFVDHCGYSPILRDGEAMHRAALRAYGILPLARMVRSPAFRNAHLSGTTVIPVLPDDTVAYVLDRLRDAGGKATLALVTHENVQLVELRSAGLPATATEDPGDAPTKNKALDQR